MMCVFIPESYIPGLWSPGTVIKDGNCTMYVLTVRILVGDCRLNISVSSLPGSRVEVFRIVNYNHYIPPSFKELIMYIFYIIVFIKMSTYSPIKICVTIIYNTVYTQINIKHTNIDKTNVQK